MSTSIDSAFAKQYEREVHHVFQQRGSKLMNTVRRKPNVRGFTTTFQKVGKGAASQKARHGAVTPMNVQHTPVECTLADYYAGDWVDKLDEAKTNTDERRVLATAGAAALGRKIDALVTEALDATTTTVTTAGGLTKAKILEGHEALGEADVFEAGRMYAVVGWKQWGQLLDIDEFKNADFIGGQLPWLDGVEAKRWLGTIWMPHSGLTKVGSDRYCHWYHEDAAGAGFGARITADITWHGDRAAHFVNHYMSMGACLIDEAGAVRINAAE